MIVVMMDPVPACITTVLATALWIFNKTASEKPPNQNSRQMTITFHVFYNITRHVRLLISFQTFFLKVYQTSIQTITVRLFTLFI